MQTLVIEQGRIFIEGVETTDPNLIGYAIIDLVQDGKSIVVKDVESNKYKNCIKDKYFKFLKSRNMSLTRERKILIGIVSEMNEFNPYDLFEKSIELETNISRPTIYNFLETCVDSEIAEIQPRSYLIKKIA